MSLKIRLGIITDDVPVSENVRAHGMNRVNTRLCQALLEHIAIISITKYRNTYRSQDLPPEFRDKCTLKAFPPMLLKVSTRLYPKLWDETQGFNTKLPALIQQLHAAQANWLFCPCGVDPSSLGRGVHLAQASGLPLAVYLVDDFLAGATLSGNQEHLQLAEHHVPQWLRKVDKIFVISDGLRDRLLDLYNLDSIVLPLPYELSKPPTTQRPSRSEEQIIFVGSLSHFYLGGLRQLATVIDSLNQELDKPIVLRLTASTIGHAKQLIGNFSCLRVKPCPTAEELDQEIASSLLCFAPYSFDAKYKEMVASSFPSKMMDYLSAGRFIVNYGPEYSSSASYFKKHNLAKVLCIDNIDMLRDVIKEQLIQTLNYNDVYRLTVKQHHSYNHIRDKVIFNISNH